MNEALRDAIVGPLWADDAASRRSRSPLSTSVAADVAIVGAGLTGLWTAHYLHASDPTLRIVVVDAERVGFGASGRNGGWCSALMPMSLAAIAGQHGADAARRMQRAMNTTIDELARVTNELAIDCHFQRGGTVTMIRNPAQLQRAKAEMTSYRTFGFNDQLRWLERSEAAAMIDAQGQLAALYSPYCAVLHPGRLVRGLAEAVEAQGATIFERSPATAIEPGRVLMTNGETITAPVVVRATEGFTRSLDGQRRALAPVYSLMIATEPLPRAVWDSIGLADRQTFTEMRHVVIYGQRTADDRLAFGGRGAPYHFASAIKPRFDADDAVHDRLFGTLCDLFPSIAGAAITHRWGGPLGVPRDWWMSVNFDQSSGLADAGGYVGDGVASSNLAGRTLAAMITRSSGDLGGLAWVGHRSRRWEPEPLRWAAINSAVRLPDGADRYERRSQRPERWRSAVLNRLLGH